MADNYRFNISIFCLNPFQIQLDDYSYSYREYGPTSYQQWESEFGLGPLSEKLQFELQDFYSGDFFDKVGTYPGPRGPGGGGYSASSYIRDVASGSITPEAVVNYRSPFELDVDLWFDKDKILSNNGEGIKKVESDLRYVIESAFKNSVANEKEVYLDPIFTRDKRRRASANPTFSSNGEPDPGYTPNGKTYSIPQTTSFKLNKSFASETTDNYYLSYYIDEIVPTPKRDPATQSGSQSSTPDSGTVSSDNLIRGNYVFNVEKSKIFSNPQLGELTIIEKVSQEGVPGENPTTEEEEPAFIFSDTEDQLDPEYMEGEFVGAEESLDDVVGEDLNSFNALNIVQTEGEKKEDYGNTQSNISTTSEPGGETNNLKPSKKGYLMGSAFKKTEQYKEKWDVTVDTTYRLTKFKFGKPKITEETFIQRVKKAEGGIANGTTDSAYRTYGDKTVLPISKKDHPNAKKYDKLCTNSDGKRLYNIHTNKGILWLVFKTQFGDSVSVQERYLKMSDEDWWTIMYKRFVVANQGEKIKSKIASYFYIYWCWGSGAGNAVPLLNTTLNLLAGQKKFTSNSISSDQINFMNDLYNSGKEDDLISAMYDVRIQNLLNISQPGNKNLVYRNGWINGINKWITDFHET